MPSKAPRVCGYCGLTHMTGEQCRLVAARDRATKARFDRKRPNARQRGYTRQWEKESKAFLEDYPMCIRCGEPAALVDHKIPHRGDQRLFWDRTNWQPLCHHCHNSAKQSEERRASKEVEP
ncbi:HNH endonuclease [Martelella radicis]|uniref:Putative HNH nuclease YajD n=1 Tax=Martelella radicis TaxID=1397476 RepID=A0A7W6KL29_9HYPH|nr:5-methylcytosine-specific restriction endonuclease McrA [Martelella radicis]